MNDFIDPSNSNNQEPLFMADFIDHDPIVIAKLRDAITPGAVVEFTPAEAGSAGAFEEDALSEHDATDSVADGDEAASPAPTVP